MARSLTCLDVHAPRSIRVTASRRCFPGKIIADAIDKVGKDGVITVEEAKSMETSLDVVEGMQFDRGYLSRLVLQIAVRSFLELIVAKERACSEASREVEPKVIGSPEAAREPEASR